MYLFCLKMFSLSAKMVHLHVLCIHLTISKKKGIENESDAPSHSVVE